MSLHEAEMEGRVDELEAEVEECDRLRERMGELLTATAAALRGQPAPLTSHDWSSIPDRTAAVVNALCGAMEYAIELRAEVERLREALEYAVRQNEHDMLLTGDECRAARAALKETK